MNKIFLLFSFVMFGTLLSKIPQTKISKSDVIISSIGLICGLLFWEVVV